MSSSTDPPPHFSTDEDALSSPRPFPYDTIIAGSASTPRSEPSSSKFEESHPGTHVAAAVVVGPSSHLPSPSYSKQDPEQPPPPYTEALSPLDSFVFSMAAAGGSGSIITQVQQGGPPLNSLADASGTGEENLTLDLRGTQFILSRDELLTLPEFVLLSLFPNGLFPEVQQSSYHDDGTYIVDFDPNCLKFMLEFFRKVSSTITVASTEEDDDTNQLQTGPTNVLQDRAGIIVLREDLDFYAIPPKRDISRQEMMEVKRAAGRVLLKQDGIFSGLRRTDDTGTTEQHLIEMLTAGGFNVDDAWGHRAGEPNKAVICSLALARLRTDSKDSKDSNVVGMAQKLLLFWRKPARRCWWEGLELEGVDGVDGKLKVWIRRVWTLEMSVIGLR